MKKLYGLLALCLVLSFLAACAAGSKSNPNARIGPAKLTEEETAMLQLCALPDALFFDFTTGSKPLVIRLTLYSLEDGEWVVVTEDRLDGVVTDKPGRLMLHDKALNGRLKYTLQRGDDVVLMDDDPVEGEAFDAPTTGTSTLMTEVAIEPGQPIPLVVQEYTSGKEFKSYGLVGFAKPELYDTANIDGALALVIQFDEQ